VSNRNTGAIGPKISSRAKRYGGLGVGDYGRREEQASGIAARAAEHNAASLAPGIGHELPGFLDRSLVDERPL